MSKEETRGRGRPSSFDRETVLETVMELFWAQSYHNVSINEIAQKTGLTRTSVYNSFKTKDELFIEALNCYCEKAPDRILKNVNEGDSVGEVLHNVLHNAATMYSSDTKNRGCMIANCMSELIGGDGVVGDYINNMYVEYRKRLNGLVQQAIRQGELPESTEPEVAAHMILIFINGFSTFSKSILSEEGSQMVSW